MRNSFSLSRYRTVGVIIDLHQAELRHRKRHKGDPKCPCGGEHPVEVEVDMERADLVPVPEIPVFLGIGEALQRLHELAHPEGTLYVQNCREPECREIQDSWLP